MMAILHLKQVVAELRKQGVELGGIGIKDTTVNEFYRPHVRVIQNVEQLPVEGLGLLKELLGVHRAEGLPLMAVMFREKRKRTAHVRTEWARWWPKRGLQMIFSDRGRQAAKGVGHQARRPGRRPRGV